MKYWLVFLGIPRSWMIIISNIRKVLQSKVGEERDSKKILGFFYSHIWLVESRTHHQPVIPEIHQGTARLQRSDPLAVHLVAIQAGALHWEDWVFLRIEP